MKVNNENLGAKQINIWVTIVLRSTIDMIYFFPKSAGKININKNKTAKDINKSLLNVKKKNLLLKVVSFSINMLSCNVHPISHLQQLDLVSACSPVWKWLSERMHVPLKIRRLRLPSPPGQQHSFVEIDQEILSLPLIQEGHLSVSGKRMCTILVNRLED